jgi:hypothetical protein
MRTMGSVSAASVMRSERSSGIDMYDRSIALTGPSARSREVQQHAGAQASQLNSLEAIVEGSNKHVSGTVCVIAPDV